MVFGILATASMYRAFKHIVNAFAAQYIEVTLIQQQQAVETKFDVAKRFVQHLGSQQWIAEYLQQKNPRMQDPALVARFANFDADKEYQAIYLMNATGTTLLSTDPTLIGQNYGFRDYFKQAIVGEPFIESAIGITTKKFGYYFSYPIKTADGRVLGVLVGKLKTELIDAVIQKNILGKNGITLLVDKHGVIIQTSAKPELLYKSLGTLTEGTRRELALSKKFGGMEIASLQYDFLQQAIGSVKDARIFQWVDTTDNREEILGIVKTNAFPFYIVEESATAMIAIETENIAKSMALFAILAYLCASAMIVAVVSRLLAPLPILKNVIHAIGEGKLDQRVEVSSRDEFEEIAQACNAIVDKYKRKRNAEPSQYTKHD